MQRQKISFPLLTFENSDSGVIEESDLTVADEDLIIFKTPALDK